MAEPVFAFQLPDNDFRLKKTIVKVIELYAAAIADYTVEEEAAVACM